MGGAMAGAAGLLRRAEVLLAKAAQPTTKVNFNVPAGACDSHVHIFGDPQRYPFVPGRVYTPETASIAELQAMLAALHMEHVVVVHPSVYGTDNRCTVDAVRQLGSKARGIAVIDAKTPEAELDEMAKVGFRGIRLNLTQAGVSDPSAARRISGGRRAREKAQLARPAQHLAENHRGAQPAAAGVAGSGRDRSFWRRARLRGRGAAWLWRARESCEVG